MSPPNLASISPTPQLLPMKGAKTPGGPQLPAEGVRPPDGPQDPLKLMFERGKAHVGVAYEELRDSVLRVWHSDKAKLGRSFSLGMAITAGCSLGVAMGLGTNLLRLAESSDAQRELLTSIPFVGNLINEMLGQAGALGAVAVAAPLLGMAMAFVTSEGKLSDRLHFAFAHAAMGVSLAPAWLIPAAQLSASMPAVALGAACLTGVSVLLSMRQIEGSASWRMAIAGASLVLAGAPLCAMAATGVATPVALAYAASVLSIGAMGMAGYLLVNSRAALADDSTARIRGARIRGDGLPDTLNLPDEYMPTVFCFDAQLLRTIAYLKDSVRNNRAFGVFPIMLSGPSGTGKTAISRAIANAVRDPGDSLGMNIDVSPAMIIGEENPARALREYFNQAKLLKKPCVMFFSDAEFLFASRDQADSDAEMSRRTLMTTTLNECIDGIQRNDKENIVVVLSTNNPAFLDPSFHSRFGACDILIDYPSRAQQKIILQATHEQEFADRSFGRNAPKLTASDIDAIVAGLPNRGDKISGRDLRDLSRNAKIILAQHEHMDPSAWQWSQMTVRKAYAQALTDLAAQTKRKMENERRAAEIRQLAQRS